MSNETNTIIKEKGQELFNMVIDELRDEPYGFNTNDFIILILEKFSPIEIDELLKQYEQRKSDKQV